MSKNPYGNPQPPHNPYSPAPPQKHPPQYQPHHGPQVSTLAVVSLVTGIMSLPFTICCGCFSAPLSLTAIVCGIVAIPQCNSGQYTGKGMAIAGLSCGAVAILIFIGLILLNVAFEIGDSSFDFDL